MEQHGTKWHGLEWHGLGRNGIKWNGMTWDGIGFCKKRQFVKGNINFKLSQRMFDFNSFCLTTGKIQKGR